MSSCVFFPSLLLLFRRVNAFKRFFLFFFFLRQSIIFASGCCIAPKVALWKQRKRWATAAPFLDQPFNPVTLSLRQTARYRSFHYVFKQQIASQVRCTGRVKREKKKGKKETARMSSGTTGQPAITLLAVQISEDSWETEKRVSIIGDDLGGKMRLLTCYKVVTVTPSGSGCGLRS